MNALLSLFPVCLSSTGQVTGLQSGPSTEKWDYDSQGRIISRVFADGKTWSYTYLDKVQPDQSGTDTIRLFH